MDVRRYLPVAVFLTVIVLIQLLSYAFGVEYYLTQLTMSAYYVLVAIGLCMLMGYAGQISLGQAGFFAIGGYTTATLTTQNFIAVADEKFPQLLQKLKVLILRENLYGEQILHIAPWVAVILALVITLVVAFLIGTPILSLKGHYLAMATLGFGIIIYRIVLGTGVFGEADGISNVPGFQLFPGLAVSGDFAERLQNYYIAWVMVVLGLVVLINLINSRVGRALRSLHGSEEAASAMGVNVARFKLNVFVLGAVFASVAGIFLTHYNGGIGPSESSVIKSVRYVAIVAVGGMANLWGTLTMGLVLNFLSLRGVFGSYDDAIFGIILILIMIFAPDGFLNIGILGTIRKRITAVFSRGKKTPRGSGESADG
jgi:branched-chain amino acid transport system permease protein